MKRLTLVLAIIMIFSSFSLTGCRKNDKSDTMIIKDCSGAEVEISKNINKIIAPNQPFCEFLIAMGLGDKLIGSHGSVIGHSWASHFKEDILSVELYGYKPAAEALLATGADLVVVKNAAYAEALRKEGVPAIYFAYNNLDELIYAVDLMGEIFGEPAKQFSSKWKSYLNDTIGMLNAELSTLETTAKKNVYYINGAVNPGTIYSTFGGGSFTEYWINTIGANFVTSPYEGIEEINQEVAISLNPDTIFISGYAAYTRLDELKADPLWSSIDAVVNDHIYVMPTAMVSFDRFAVELPLLLEYSANILYPDLHSFDAEQEFFAFFKEFYGKEFSNIEIQYMIKGLNPDGSRMD